MTNHKFNLTGLTCEACLKLVRKKIGKIADVQGVQIDLTGNLLIEIPREISNSEIRAALAGTPYAISNGGPNG